MNMYFVTAPPTTTAPTSTPIPSPSPAVSAYTYQGCVKDGGARALTGYFYSDGAMTVAKCASTSSATGFSLAGLEV